MENALPLEELASPEVGQHLLGEKAGAWDCRGTGTVEFLEARLESLVKV